ncbi:hypothetical protein SKAU_G00306430 [Synaphobranchus kaupii]|uniref:Uncharacterized protein n=1 Tax=Synaphobranchus kaupii TaxID=118154 RepID=A0A9Q1IIQ6_SYNKA|nr:hypothetical protein SKAU_G00306430 [Synaphobranchus kaupii]
MTAHDCPGIDEKKIDNCTNMQCKDFYVMEIQGDTPDSSPGLRESPSVTTAGTGHHEQASRPDEASRSPAPQHRGPPDRVGRDAAEEPRREDNKDDRGGSLPEVVITQADEGRRAAVNPPGGDGDTGRSEGTASVNISSSQTNGGDPSPSCCDLQSLKSDSEAANSGKAKKRQQCICCAALDFI